MALDHLLAEIVRQNGAVCLTAERHYLSHHELPNDYADDYVRLRYGFLPPVVRQDLPWEVRGHRASVQVPEKRLLVLPGHFELVLHRAW